MSKRKNHHYIPRFYLKHFATNEDRKAIGLYNLDNKKFIENAPIKHQASSDYLYGNDEVVESWLADIEGVIAKMFYYWIDEKTFIPPPENSNGYLIFKRFILYQLHRTPKAGRESIEHLNEAMLKILPLLAPEIKGKIDGLKLEHPEPILYTLFKSTDKEYLLDYLKFKFVVNLSDLPFLTSDSPVILYNEFMEKSGNYIGATGLASKGLQIFYPIHPRLMICMYDPFVYKCKESENCVSTDKVEDIHQFNVMQYLNCDTQLFFDDTICKEYIETNIVDEYEHLKTPQKSINTIINNGNNKLLFFTGIENFHINLNLSFMKVMFDSKIKSSTPSLRALKK